MNFLTNIWNSISGFFEKEIDKMTGHGWKPDVPDHRDYSYTPLAATSQTLVDLRSSFPVPYNQGDLNSCVANAVAGAIQFDKRKQKLTDFIPSRLFIYWNTRNMEGTVNQNTGTYIRDAIKAVVNQGAPNETIWPYIQNKFKIKPSTDAYNKGMKNQVLKYYRVNNTESDIKACLAEGFPIVFGATLYSSFESDTVAKTGMVPYPGKEESLVGGHALLIVGFDDIKKMYIIRNSWGTSWGNYGYCFMPYAYVNNTNLADDFWTIRSVE